MKIGFLGAGNMGRAMAKGLVAQGTCVGGDLLCISGTGKGAKIMAQQTGARIAESAEDLIRQSDIVVLAFKPQHLGTVSEAQSAAARGKLIVSALAGRTLESLSQTFPNAANIARIMPNTPAQIGKGVSTYCFARDPAPEQQAAIEKLLSSLGAYHSVREEQLHIATVINGCGPAFYFRIMELIGNAAERQGLDARTAIQLAAETAIGSLELLLRSERDPRDLIEEVVSPNGVTHALLESLERHRLPEVIDRSVRDAVQRSVELSKPD